MSAWQPLLILSGDLSGQTDTGEQQYQHHDHQNKYELFKVKFLFSHRISPRILFPGHN